MTLPRRYIVFLDFDGVMVNKRSWYVRSGLQATADPPCVAALNRIIRETGAEIVVSSTWRMGTEVVELRQLLKNWGVEAKVIGKTPVLLDGYTEKPRGEEIQYWLDAYPRDVDAFVILDDDGDMGKLKHRLVQTEFDDGLTDDHATTAIELLLDSKPSTHGESVISGLAEQSPNKKGI